MKKEVFFCKFCDRPCYDDPADQTPPADYCIHECLGIPRKARFPFADPPKRGNGGGNCPETQIRAFKE
jgi:hypothetical protein